MSARATTGCPTRLYQALATVTLLPPSSLCPTNRDHRCLQRRSISIRWYAGQSTPLLGQLARGQIGEVAQRSPCQRAGPVRVWLGRENGVAISNLPGTSVCKRRAVTLSNRLFSAVRAYDGLSHGSSWVVLFSGSQCVHTCWGCWSGFPVAPGGGGDDGSALMTAAKDGVDVSRLWCTATSVIVVMLAVMARLPSVAMIIAVGRRWSPTRWRRGVSRKSWIGFI